MARSPMLMFPSTLTLQPGAWKTVIDPEVTPSFARQFDRDAVADIAGEDLRIAVCGEGDCAGVRGFLLGLCDTGSADGKSSESAESGAGQGSLAKHYGSHFSRVSVLPVAGQPHPRPRSQRFARDKVTSFILIFCSPPGGSSGSGGGAAGRRRPGRGPPRRGAAGDRGRRHRGQ